MKTNFIPASHGYKFPNRFEHNLPNILIKTIIRNSVYGLCGGMVFSALDYFFDKSLLNSETSPTNLTPEFVNYLWQRQFDSMPLTNYFSLVRKTFQNDRKLMMDTINHQIPLIIESLNAGVPSIIIIIRSKNIKNPTDNHQILLTDYKINGPITEFTSYDPNHPSKDTFLRICRIFEEESITQSTGERVRGFFVNKYRQKTPWQNSIVK